MRKRWLAASYDKDLAAQIAEEHSLNPIAALLAVIRGLRDNEEIEDFFDPNPFLLSIRSPCRIWTKRSSA